MYFSSHTENFFEDELPEMYFPLKRLCIATRNFLIFKNQDVLIFEERVNKKWSGISLKNSSEEQIFMILNKNMKNFRRICYLSLLEFEYKKEYKEENDFIEIFAKYYEGGENQMKKDHSDIVYEYKKGKTYKIKIKNIVVKTNLKKIKIKIKIKINIKIKIKIK